MGQSIATSKALPYAAEQARHSFLWRVLGVLSIFRGVIGILDARSTLESISSTPASLEVMGPVLYIVMGLSLAAVASGALMLIYKRLGLYLGTAAWGISIALSVILLSLMALATGNMTIFAIVIMDGVLIFATRRYLIPEQESGLRLPKWIPGWLASILRNSKATFGLVVVLFFVLVAIFASVIAPGNPTRMGGRPHEPPSAQHIYGTSRQGQDIFTQVVHGARGTLVVGFVTGTMIIGFCILMGVTAGYVGGFVDELISLITNIFLVLPGLPLIIVVAGWVEQPGPLTIILVLGLTNWAYGARVLRSQALTLRNSEFVAAARVVGEPTWRIVISEMLPNMSSLVVSSWIGATVFVILSEATLSFIGLGNPSATTWGSILYWAQNNQALLTKAWWTFIPAGMCIAAIGMGLTMLNYGIDEITNPRLRTEGKKKK